METDAMDSVIAEVNAFAARHNWMDFSVWNYNGWELEISGAIFEYYGSNLRVVFAGVCWACIRFQGWKSDTGRPVLLRVDGPEAYAVNRRFQIEVGHHLFKFVAEDFTEPMWIAAQEIRADVSWLKSTGEHGAKSSDVHQPLRIAKE